MDPAAQGSPPRTPLGQAPLQTEPQTDCPLRGGTWKTCQTLRSVCGHQALPCVVGDCGPSVSIYHARGAEARLLHSLGNTSFFTPNTPLAAVEPPRGCWGDSRPGSHGRLGLFGFFLSSPEGIFPLIFRESGREEERQEKETHRGRLPPTGSPVGDQACNRGTSPPFGLWADALSAEPTGQGSPGASRRVARTEVPAWRWLRQGLTWGKWFELHLTLSLTCRGRATSLHTGLWFLRN